MATLNNIKIELCIFLIVFFSAFFIFSIDINFNNYFLTLGFFSNSDYLKEFFVKITKLGSSSWYFTLIIFSALILFLNKKIGLLKLANYEKNISFFISSFIYLLSAGIFTQILKHLIGRARPNYTDYNNNTNFEFFNFESSHHSFPSGHSSTIFMVCLILCTMLPKLKYYFFFLASTIAISRVVVGAHFLTDVIAGGLLSLIVFKILNSIFKKKNNKYLFTKLKINGDKNIYYVIIFLLGFCLFTSVSPELDLFVAGVFYYGDSQFFLQSYNLLSQVFRDVLLPLILVYILILPIFVYFTNMGFLFFGYKFSIKQIFLIWITQLLSVVIFVNIILKSLWGRARPGDIIQYGGDSLFTPWYLISNECDKNCSFISGDASVGFSLIIFYLITKNIFYIYFSIILGIALGIIRILAGGHFLSDIVFAGFFIIILNVMIYKVYRKYYDK